MDRSDRDRTCLLYVMNDVTTQPGVQGSVYLLALILLYLIKFRLILM